MYKPIKFTITTIQILFCLFLIGCSKDIFGPAKKNPRIGEENISVITGTTDGMKFSDFNKSSQTGDSMPVNALLWRAALDIASFVPLDDVDTFGGSIVTEWHQPKDTPNQRLKLTMFVLAANCVPMQSPFAPISKTGLALNGLMLAVMKRLAASWKIWY